MSKFLCMSLSGLVLAVVYYVRRRMAVARLNRLEEDNACVSCHSTNTVVAGTERLCSDCGYVGRFDGGGKLVAADLEGFHDN